MHREKIEKNYNKNSVSSYVRIMRMMGNPPPPSPPSPVSSNGNVLECAYVDFIMEKEWKTHCVNVKKLKK